MNQKLSKNIKFSISMSVLIILAHYVFGMKALENIYENVVITYILCASFIIPIFWIVYIGVLVKKGEHPNFSGFLFALEIGFLYLFSAFTFKIIVLTTVVGLLSLIEFLGSRIITALEELKSKEKENKIENSVIKKTNIFKRHKKTDKKYLNRIFWKSMRSNSRSFVFFYLSAILTTVLIFNLYGISEFIIQLVKKDIVDAAVGEVIGSMMQMIVVLSVFLLTLSIIQYIRARMNDYGMFLTLGIRKKILYRFILREYALCWFLSTLTGILVGTVTAKILEQVMISMYQGSNPAISVSIYTYLKTIVWSGVIFGVAFIICDELIACLGLQELMAMGKKKGRIPNKKMSASFVLIGIILVGFSLFALQNFIGQKSVYVPIVICIIGMYFIMVFGIALILNKLKEKKNMYYKQLLKINSLYYRFFANINVLFIISILMFIMVYSFSLKVTDNLPVDVSTETYPYDLVWMADEGDKVLLEDLKQKYAITYEQVPIIRVTTAEYGENIGISKSEFYKWSGQDISLKGRDIYIIYQRNEQAGNTIGISWGDTKPLIHIGKGEKYFWYMYGTDFSTPSYQYFSKDYKVKGIKTNNLIGQLRDNMNENIILFSDEYYEQVKENAEGASLMVLINIPDSNRDIVKGKINEYAKTHSERYFVDNTISVYDKEYMMIKDKAQHIMNLTVYIFMIVLIVICSILILGMKLFADIDDVIEKDQFFSCLGMNKKERRKIIRSQCRAASWIPIGMGIITGVVFLVREIKLRGMSYEVEIMYWKTVDILMALYLIVYIIAVIIIEYIVVRTVEREQKS